MFHSTAGVALLALVLFGCPQKAPQAPAPGTSTATPALHASSRSSSSENAKPVEPEKGAAPVASAFAERAAEREALVRESIQAEGVRDPRVLEAMRKVPRHRFVPPEYQPFAYEDRPLSIGHGQTISQPFIVAAMTAEAAPKPTDRCLEIGTGSGYQAAVLAELCERVFSIEYLPDVARFGAQNLSALGYTPGRVELRVGDGYRGWPEAAPFNVILVTAAPDHIPQPLLDQLAPGGRLVIPIGPEQGDQRLERWVRVAPGRSASAFRRQELMGVRFVPFLGEAGKKTR